MARLGYIGLLAGLLLASSPVAAQTTLRIGLAEDPDVLDPTLARTYVGRIVFASLCDKLFDIDEQAQHRAATGALARDFRGRQDGHHQTAARA